MSLDYAILGFLSYKPFTGYDLKKMFDNSVRHFWSADQSQIYRTLTRLQEQGWVDLEVIHQEDRPDRKVYHITDEGRRNLHEWLAGPFPMQESRSAPLVQVFFSGQLSDEEILAKFEVAAQIFRGILARYEEIPATVEEYTRIVGSDRESFFWMLTLEMGKKTVQAQLEWAESVIERIKTHQIPEK